MSNTADFTQGSILKKLCRFMLPVLGALILQAAYGAVDLLVVGQFGSTAGGSRRADRELRAHLRRRYIVHRCL